MCQGYLDRHGGHQCETWYPETGANRLLLVESPDPGVSPPDLGVVKWPEFALEFRDYVTPEQRAQARDARGRQFSRMLRTAMEQIDQTGEDAEVILPDDWLDDVPQTVLIGGPPRRVQGDETPRCPICGGLMKLLAQIDSEVRHRDFGSNDGALDLPFGGGGVAYAFVCERECSPEGTDLMWQCT
jgi:hypothetical protein